MVLAAAMRLSSFIAERRQTRNSSPSVITVSTSVRKPAPLAISPYLNCCMRPKCSYGVLDSTEGTSRAHSSPVIGHPESLPLQDCND